MRRCQGSTFWKGGRSVLVGLSLAATAGVARADDGLFSFFQNAFGGGPVRHAQLPPDGSLGYEYDAPPLTVRRHPRRHSAAPARTPQEVLADSKDVTIYTDKTLARGDIVMTAHGLRVFNGSEAWPYTDGDFVEVSAKARIAPDMRKELHSIDAASRIASGY